MREHELTEVRAHKIWRQIDPCHGVDRSLVREGLLLGRRRRWCRVQRLRDL